MAKDKAKTDAIKALFPGRIVEISGVEIKVEPLGFRHIRKFSDGISKIMPTLVSVISDVKADERGWISKLSATLAPFLMTDLLDLVDDCVDVDLKEVPHHLLPRIIEAWIEESFGDEGKVKPWKTLFTTILKRFATSQGSISQGSLTSSSEPGTQNPT